MSSYSTFKNRTRPIQVKVKTLLAIYLCLQMTGGVFVMDMTIVTIEQGEHSKVLTSTAEKVAFPLQP